MVQEFNLVKETLHPSTIRDGSSSLLSHLCFLFSLHGLVVNISLEEKFAMFNGKKLCL